MICNCCNRDIKRNPREVEEEILCGACYVGKMCVFCDPNVKKEECPGHSIESVGINRFTSDEKFVLGTPFQ